MAAMPSNGAQIFGIELQNFLDSIDGPGARRTFCSEGAPGRIDWAGISRWPKIEAGVSSIPGIEDLGAC